MMFPNLLPPLAWESVVLPFACEGVMAAEEDDEEKSGKSLKRKRDKRSEFHPNSMIKLIMIGFDMHWRLLSMRHSFQYLNMY